ncbi:unnamed protein product [Mytilus coruscus]|uniref:VWFA domain-containing protein n=1 Tax=Mytilus coruscus TaxID=42192 RepID=A0A6J8AHS6_MYTCO|nr:unnamed protein product [Mytilus coruscus]
MSGFYEKLKAFTPFQSFIQFQSIQNEEQKEVSKEQILNLQIHLPKDWNNSFKNYRTYLIIAVDTSGSMGGNPIKQVKTALHELLSQTIPCSDIKTDVISYNSEVSLLELNTENYQEKIDGLKASSMTNFIIVFDKLDILLSKYEHSYDRAVVVFMTDGQDTANTKEMVNKRIVSWKKRINSFSLPVTVHSVGFSKDHNFKFLKDLTEAGEGTGMFRYCEQSEGPDTLTKKLQELFDFIVQGSGQHVDVHFSINEDNKIDDNGKKVQSCVVTAPVAKNLDSDEPVVIATTWILNQAPSVCPTIKVHISYKLKVNNTLDEVTFPCEVCDSSMKIMTSVKDKCLWNIRILSRSTDTIATKLSEIITSEGDASGIEKRLTKLQERLSRIPLYGKDINKSLREEIYKMMSDIQGKINKMFTLIAEFARKETPSVGMLARAHDMRYQAQFSKSRRHRLMDRRATKNLSSAKTAQEELTALQIDVEDLKNIPQETCDFFFCVLSQNSIKDVLIDSDPDDLIGFGLTVKRTEFILDEPSLIWIHNISGTVVSKTAMMDALEFKLKVDGQLQAHGGFNFDLGVTTVGLGREPINAWLPLYVNQTHWQKVKILLKPVLGFLCTLDPLGYDYKQIDVMFMTLGSMVSQLSDVQEHQLKMIFVYQRTCRACLVDFDLVEQVTTVMTNFIASPAGRTKDVIPNLLTLIGYLLSLPKDKLKFILQMDGKPVQYNMDRFWLAFTTELLRRAGGNLFKDSKTNVVYSYIDSLVNGFSDDKTCCDEPESSFKQIFKKEFDQKEEIVPTEFDIKSGLPLQPPAPIHSVKCDKAMDIWAQSKCGLIRNKNQAEKVSQATKLVNEWIKEGQKLTAEQTDSIRLEEDKAESDNITVSILRLLVQVYGKLSNAAYPRLSCIPGCMGFVSYWLGDRDIIEMDQNGGLPPVAWLEGAKQSVSEMYQCIEEDTLEDVFVVDEISQDTVPTAAAGTDIVENVQRNTVDSVQTGKDNSNDSDDDDDEDDDFEYGVSDYDDNDLDYVSSSEITKKKNRNINITSVLKLLDRDVDIIEMSRILVCQILQYHSNSKARTAIQNGDFVDLSVTDGKVLNEEVLKLRNHLQSMKMNAIKDFMAEMIWKRANHCMLMTDSIWAFLGYLMNTYTDRNEGVSWMLAAMTDESAESIPLLAEKVKIIFLGKYQDHDVLARGNVYLPEGKTAKKFSKVLGEEAWTDIEISLRSQVTLHCTEHQIYRTDTATVILILIYLTH